MYEVLISNEAEKYYKKLDKNTKQRINTLSVVSAKNRFQAFTSRSFGADWKESIDTL
jgi:mRNA-degrading endonuclease RelE of RelBE toxin-antitoxin system